MMARGASSPHAKGSGVLCSLLAAVGLVTERTCLIDGVRGGFAGDQAGAAAEGQIFESPLYENADAALELHDVNQMDEKPHEPGEQPGNVDAKNIGDRGRAADDGHFTLIEIAERRRRRLAFDAGTDDFCVISAALHSDLRHAGERRSLLIDGMR